MYLIQNIHYKNYYQRQIKHDIFHFVCDFKDATRFKDKKEANKILKLFKHKNNFEIIKLQAITPKHKKETKDDE